jgi:mannitol-1-phosphate 5-dehydrogenase
LKTDSKSAVMYGGGSIGRGFLGQLFYMSGYKTCFIDVDKNLVEELSRKQEYEIKVALPTGYEAQTIKNVTAVNGLDAEKVAEVISQCNIMATAVGVNILPRVAKTIALGLDKRYETSGNPLDIVVCENMSDGGLYLKTLVLEHAVHKDFIESSIGFVSASVGRMVPVSDSADIIVESYNELPIDKDALKTDVSDLKNFIPVSPFAIEKYKKYFMHNMSHAIVAYMGYLKGCEYLWQAMEDKEILMIAKGALSESIKAISKYFNADKEPLELYADDLLNRYTNKYLGDTVLRVGRDPVRKLGKDDRLSGAALFCIKNGFESEHIPYGIAAALCFDSSNDVSAPSLQEYIEVNSIEAAISHFTGIDCTSTLAAKIIQIYFSIKQT